MVSVHVVSVEVRTMFEFTALGTHITLHVEGGSTPVTAVSFRGSKTAIEKEPMAPVSESITFCRTTHSDTEWKGMIPLKLIVEPYDIDYVWRGGFVVDAGRLGELWLLHKNESTQSAEPFEFTPETSLRSPKGYLKDYCSSSVLGDAPPCLL
ncbi:hypothetical protein Pelo_3780 [Pelomyxa schiedti]|nr:hypothetical protein Pelo_3780 [Pelomyxa schiedti]